jgi:hypothetical protein
MSPVLIMIGTCQFCVMIAVSVLFFRHMPGILVCLAAYHDEPGRHMSRMSSYFSLAYHVPPPATFNMVFKSAAASATRAPAADADAAREAAAE